MASSIAYYINLDKDHNRTGAVTEVLNENQNLQKLTAVDKAGGILCCVCGTKFVNKKSFESHFSAHNQGKVVYSCVACQKQHSTYSSFRNHVYLQHIIKHKFICPHCNKPFSKQSALDAHISAIHEFKCGDCDEKFKTKKDLQFHKIIHNKKGTNDPPYNCVHCNQVIETIDICVEHMDNHSEVLYPCPICPMILSNNEEAMLHVSIHFTEKTTVDMAMSDTEDSSLDALGGILCCHCDLLFKKRSDIDAHFQSEHEEKTIVYTCNICEKQYTSYPSFGNHCYLHISKDKFQCDQCHKLFPRLSLLVMHNLAFHSQGPSEKPFRCDKCIYGFESHYRLLSHKKIVHDEITVKCLMPDCFARFNTPKELIVHQLEHRSCLENWCRQCGLQFATRAACARHLVVHRRKRYACPVCARQYRERYLTLKHLPKHFECVLHICKVCGKSYRARNRLIEHAARSHSDSSRKYKCSHCDKAFARPYEREQHERVHTGLKPYTCAECQRTFACYPNWTKHLARKHAYDKEMIRQAREARIQTAASPTKLSPMKNESGIESASSADSGDEGRGGHRPVKKLKRQLNSIKNDQSNILENTIVETESILSSCLVTSAVNAIIEHIEIDEHLDLVDTKLDQTTDFIETAKFTDHPQFITEENIKFSEVPDFIAEGTVEFTENTEFITQGAEFTENTEFITQGTAEFTENTEFLGEESATFTENTGLITKETAKLTENAEFTSEFSHLDDSSDIKAIVEHIDALSGGLELAAPTQHAVDAVDEEIMRYADLVPAITTVYDSVPVSNEHQYYQPSSLPLEYGPDFNTLGSEVYTTDSINLNDFVLPHIDPLLTIKEQNARLLAQDLPNSLYGGVDSTPYEPNWGGAILTKIYSYDETNDMNRMYALNGNLF